MNTNKNIIRQMQFYLDSLTETYFNKTSDAKHTAYMSLELFLVEMKNNDFIRNYKASYTVGTDDYFELNVMINFHDRPDEWANVKSSTAHK